MIQNDNKWGLLLGKEIILHIEFEIYTAYERAYLLIWYKSKSLSKTNKILSITYPRILPLIVKVPIGLIPIRLVKNNYPKLIVKVTKEAILAAKLNKGFGIYVVPLNYNSNRHTDWKSLGLFWYK